MEKQHRKRLLGVAEDSLETDSGEPSGGVHTNVKSLYPGLVQERGSGSAGPDVAQSD